MVRGGRGSVFGLRCYRERAIPYHLLETSPLCFLIQSHCFFNLSTSSESMTGLTSPIVLTIQPLDRVIGYPMIYAQESGRRSFTGGFTGGFFMGGFNTKARIVVSTSHWVGWSSPWYTGKASRFSSGGSWLYALSSKEVSRQSSYSHLSVVRCFVDRIMQWSGPFSPISPLSSSNFRALAARST